MIKIDMDDINDILHNCGIENLPTPPLQSEEPAIPTENNTSITDDDIDNILEENGYLNTVEEGNGILDPEFEDIENNEETPVDNLSQAEEEFQEALEEHLSNNTDSTADTSSISNDSAKIPLNSPTLLVDESTSRFSGAEWFNAIRNTKVIIAGLGGIGSNVAFQIARMIPLNLTLYDADEVELANMAGQLYSLADAGKNKVDAIADMIRLYTSINTVNAISQNFTARTEPGDIMICGFDNMRARSVFFTSWKNHIENKSMKERAKCLYLDGRLSMDCLQVLCIKGDDEYNIDRYNKEFLFSDIDADATVCSMKQTTYLACMIGSIMTNLFTNFVAGTLNPVIPYDLPFFTEYEAQSMIFKTES